MFSWSYKAPFLSFSMLCFLLVVFLLFRFLKKTTLIAQIPIWLESNVSGSAEIYIIKALKWLGLSIGILFFFIALARPYTKEVVSNSSQEGIDILFVLDISDSMLIEDMPPLENRLESAKFHIKEFMKERPHDRMGLVVFSGEAYTRVPLTMDHGLLVANLEDLTILDYMKKGTAIGVALSSGVNRIRESKSKSKVIVLLTDGENNTGVIDPITALELAVDDNIKTYTIGIGRDGMAQLPIFSKDRFGRKTKRYRPFPTKINEELLKKIAFRTGGQFFRASTGKGLGDVFKSINDVETYEIKSPDVFSYTEFYQKPLVYSLIIFLLMSFCEIILFWRGF